MIHSSHPLRSVTTPGFAVGQGLVRPVVSTVFQLFDKLNTEHPGLAKKKLITVQGDLSKIRLGLSDDDYRMLSENVSVVFHVAATVRFNESIRDTLIKNVRGTREVIQLAKQMATLKVSIRTNALSFVRVFKSIFFSTSSNLKQYVHLLRVNTTPILF